MLATALLLTAPACSNERAGHTTDNAKVPAVVSTPQAATRSPAADFRARLNYLLGEHIMLMVKATGSSLGGRTEEFAAYRDLLDRNGTDLGGMVGSLHGDAAKGQFSAIWSAQNGFFVAYSRAVANDDATGKQEAVQRLTTTYVPQFSELMTRTMGIPQNVITNLTAVHTTLTIAVIDSQAARDWPAVYRAIRTAYSHTRVLGDAISQAMSSQKGGRLVGDAGNKAVDLRVNLDQALQEHLYLTTLATGAAIAGRTGEFGAASAAVNSNGADIGSTLGSLYGQEAQARFNGIWSSHIGFFIDYVTAVAANEEGGKQLALNKLATVYVAQFSDFIATAAGILRDTVASLTAGHVATTAAVVDAQGARDAPATGARERIAAQHLMMLGDPLAEAIVARFPDRFQS